MPFSKTKLRKIEENSLLLIEDLSRQRLKFHSKPLMLEFSVNNLCNLRCVMCRPQAQPKLELAPELIKGVLVEELMPSAVGLLPSSGSEPFLGDLSVLGEGCSRHELQLLLITNGTLITREKLENIAPNIGRIHISMDGHRADLYESIRVGARFDRVVKNIELVAGFAQREGFDLLLSSVFSLGMVPEVDQYVRFAAGLGADTVAFQKIHHATPRAAQIDAFEKLDKEVIEDAMDTAIKTAEEERIDIYFDFHPPRFKAFNPRDRKLFLQNDVEKSLLHRFPDMCYMAASYVKIHPDGNVQPCCAAGDHLKLGNLNQNSFQSIWNGRAYQKLRKSLFKKRPFPPCSTCPILKRGQWDANARDQK